MAANWHAQVADYENEYDPYAYLHPNVPLIPPEYDMQAGHTGDPARDMEIERNIQQGGPAPSGGSSAYQAAAMPEPIREYIVTLHRCVVENNLPGIGHAYEVGFQRLTDKFCRNSMWPQPDVVAKLVPEGSSQNPDKDRLFHTLYKELFYRHVYARLEPTVIQRFESYVNYCTLFAELVNANAVQFDLPEMWLWDILDEFIYQFQTFCQYRTKLAKKSEEELETLAANTKIWNVHSVLNVLHQLVSKSRIIEQLQAAPNNPTNLRNDEFARLPLYRQLGYFALIQLCRLQCIFGDYAQALQFVAHIDLSRQHTYTRVSSCIVGTYYYVSFAYMMMRRYQDAIVQLVNALLFIQRTKQSQPKFTLFDSVNKQSDQLFILLAICLVLHPQRIDETINSQLQEKFAEKLAKLQKGDVDEFEASFAFACPKFISPLAPDYDAMRAMSKEQLLHYAKVTHMQQTRVFIDEVEQQLAMPHARSYLKLYTTLPIAKLASFMDLSETDLLETLMCIKHKQRNPVWRRGVGAGVSSSGTDAPRSDTDVPTSDFATSSELDFYADGDMIYIADTKVQRRYNEFFMKQILKFQELHRNLRNVEQQLHTVTQSQPQPQPQPQPQHTN